MKLQNNLLKTFKNFITSENTSIPFDICFDYSKKSTPNMVYIHGLSALGKTHLANATYNKIVDNSPEEKIIIINAYDLMKDMINFMKKNKIIQFHEKYNACNFLIIDDFQELKNKTGTQEHLIKIIDHLNNKKILLFSSTSLDDLEGFDPKIISRLKSFFITELHYPDIKTKYKIAKLKSIELDFPLSKKELRWPTYLCEDSREIEGVLLKMKIASDHYDHRFQSLPF